MSKLVKELIEISQYAGNRTDYIQGGGGNTSVKEKGLMVIKASGFRLCDMAEDKGYVAVNATKIKDYYENVDLTLDVDREKESSKVAQDNVLAIEGMPILRPSVEVGFHAILKKYVVHTHSVYANLLTCSLDGEKIAHRLFDGRDFGYVFMPYINPGFTLSVEMIKVIRNYVEMHGTYPEVIFLRNHGLIVTSDYLSRAKVIHTEVNELIRKYFGLEDNFRNVKLEAQEGKLLSKTPLVKRGVQLGLVSKEAFDANPLYPDQLVYLNKTVTLMPEKMNVVNNEVVYDCSAAEAQTLEEALAAFVYVVSTLDEKGLKISLMNKKEVDFINNWEAEKYRRALVK